MRTVVTITAAALLLASIAGCGAGGSASTSAPATTSAPASTSAPATSGQASPPTSTRSTDPPRRPRHRSIAVQVTRTPYGRALVDGRGFALYRFTHDRAKTSTCYAACAAAWPPYIVSKRPSAAGHGADGHLLGTVRRTDGRLQVTYAGHPLYYYVGDRHPREVLCQAATEYGGTWYVVAADGSAIT